MKHAFVRRVLTGLLSVLPLAGSAGDAAPVTHRAYPLPPDSPLALLPVDPRVKAHAPGRDGSGDNHRDRGYPPEWIRQRGTPVYDQATAITWSRAHVYTVGNSGEGLDGNTSAGAQDTFLMKHSLAGHHEWTRQLGSPGNDYATGVAAFTPADPTTPAFLYVTGYTSGRMPSAPGLNAGGVDLFLTQYDDGGNANWTKQLGSSGGDYAQAVATDAAGNVYVAGYTTGNLDNNTSAGLKDLFLVKYDASGNKKWTRQLGTTKNDEARAVTVDANGAIYVTGLTHGTLPGSSQTNLGDADMFLAKYDASGNRQWLKQFGTSDVDVAQGVTTTRSATGAVDVYVSGYTLGSFAATRAGGYDAVVARYSAEGTAGWKVQRGSAGNDLAYGITTDGAGSLFFTGTTNYDLGTNLSAGSNDVFLTELRAADGVHKLSRQLGSTHPSDSLAEGDIAFGVTVDNSGGIYVAGYTEGEFADTLLAGDKDVLIAKYGLGGCDVLPLGTCGDGLYWGDPHTVTFDGNAYDFQAVGEFILAESTSGAPFTLQVRQAYYTSSASIISAVAARVGTDTVVIHRGGGSNVSINGAPRISVTGVLQLQGGGAISRRSDGSLMVAWPGAERMVVYDYGVNLNLYVYVPAAYRGNVRGLLGNDNGNPADDLALRDGTPLAAPLTFEQLYRDADSFTHSWRITQAESLFDYEPGRNTASYTDPNAPYSWASNHHLTPQQRMDAETICLNAGVTQPFALEACILDVSQTGDPAFAAGAAQAQAFLSVRKPNDPPLPAAQPIYWQDFSGTVGSEWSHTQTSTSPVGNRKFLGAFDNTPVTLVVPNLPDHTKVTLSFDLFVIGGWAGDEWGVNLDGVGEQRTTFSNTPGVFQQFPVWNAVASDNAARSGAAEANTLGYAAGDSVYKVKFTVDHLDPALRLDFFGVGLGLWGVDNVQVQLQ
ncbi:beta-propeller repeat-containing protein [Archangium gephyra]|nr:SBBP repeat-containing protein [Archangium gephyra]REG28069.1 beta-propeller repeat-containing protein [Archangium gephyra]